MTELDAAIVLVHAPDSVELPSAHHRPDDRVLLLSLLASVLPRALRSPFLVALGELSELGRLASVLDESVLKKFFG